MIDRDDRDDGSYVFESFRCVVDRKSKGLVAQSTKCRPCLGYHILRVALIKARSKYILLKANRNRGDGTQNQAGGQ